MIKGYNRIGQKVLSVRLGAKQSFLIAILSLLLNFNSYAQLPGSGTAINFGGSAATNPSIVITNSAVAFPNLTTNFTITAWIKVTNNTQIGQRIFLDDEHKTSGYAFSLGDPGTGRLRFYSRNTSSGAGLFILDGTTVLATNTWYYVAAVVNITAKTVSIYVNGVLDVTGTDSRSGTFGTDAGAAAFGGETPASSEAGSGYYVRGVEDEVIVWNSALTQAQLEAAMCAKQPSPYSGILGYWNCDNATIAAGVVDLTSNGYKGSFSTGMANSDVITSGAAIGDESVYNYSGPSWVGVTLSPPTAANGIVFTVSNIIPPNGTNAPVGVEVYEVNSVPNTTAGITGLGSNNVYFGVYTTGGTNVKYDAKIDYTNYDKITTAQVFMRTDNSITTWTAGNTNTTPPPYSITETTVTTRDEFILGATTGGLPIQLISFTADCYNNTALLQWSTATETNNSFFTIERTQDGINFETVGIVKGAGNSESVLSYSFTDNSPLPGTSYYRLSQTDIDGTTVNVKEIVYVPCENQNSVNAFAYNSAINLQINSTGSYTYNVSLLNVLGQVVYSSAKPVVMGLNIFTLNPNLPQGIYILRVESANSIYTNRMLLGY